MRCRFNLSFLFQVLQPIKDLDFAKLKLPAVKLTELKDLVVSLTDQIGVLRENGSLVASADLEVHLMFILRSLGSCLINIEGATCE